MSLFSGMNMKNQAGQIILRHVIKLGLTIAIIAFLIWAVGPIIFYRISTIQDAEDLAGAIASDYKMYQNEDQAVQEGAEKLRFMGYSDEEIGKCVVEFLPVGAQPKTSVRVTVVKIATNSVINYLGWLKRFAKISTSKEASI